MLHKVIPFVGLAIIFMLLLSGAYLNEFGLTSISLIGIILLPILYLISIPSISTIQNSVMKYLLIFVLILNLIFVLGPSLFFVGFYILNNQVADNYSVLTVFQSDIGEIITYISKEASMIQLLLVFVIIMLPFYAFYQMYKNVTIPSVANIGKNKLFANSSVQYLGHIFLIILLFIIPSTTLSSMSYFKEQYATYQNELNNFRRFNNYVKEKKINFTAAKEEKNETYIVVIGESLNREHMQLYGYHRPTTPRLNELRDNNKLLVFQNFISNHTHTTKTLSLALSVKNQYNAQYDSSFLSIVNVLNQAGFETHWVSNQVRYGVWDNAVGVIADNADHKVYHNKYVGKTFKNKNYDDIVLEDIRNILDSKTKKNKVIFVHLIGNHWNYKDRYREAFKTFDGAIEIGEFGKRKKNGRQINDYDNSVLFNDFIVASIIEELKEEENKIKSMVYFSDHSEEVWEGKNHQSSKFTYSMTHIPFIMWSSEKYKEKYNDIYQTLKTRQNAFWTNDLFYEMLLGLMNVKTDKKSSTLDITSKEFNLPLDDIVTLHGKVNYCDTTNTRYIIKKNIDSLAANQLLERVIPHRVNTIGKLAQIQTNGYNSFELDALFKENGSQQYFEVGHGKKSMSGKKFSTFLDRVDKEKSSKIWLDLKNLHGQNIEKVATLLDKLDQQYSIKEKVIVESKIKSDKFKILSEKGYHTSYYLPTNISIIDNEKRLKELAAGIANQVNKQSVTAISFDKKLYTFTKKYLEPLLDKKVEYHLWDLKLNVSKPDFLQTLLNKNYYKDNRVRTILFSYPSKYNL